MKVAVTGGSGQLGTQLLRRLVADPDVTAIVSIDKRAPIVVSEKLRAITADIRDADFEKHLAHCDALFHFAFMVTVKAPRDLFWGVNVEGSKNVFRAAAKAGVKTIVYSSSIAAYGVVPGHPTPIVEDTPRVHQPSFPYSATKFEVEEFLDAFENEHPNIAVGRIRPTILVGDRMEHALGHSLARRTLPASGHAPMPIVWDEDVADMAMLAMKKRARGAFNASAEDLLSPTELARATGLRALRVSKKVAVLFAKASPVLERLGLGQAMDVAWVESGDVTMIPSCDKAKRELGWTPRCKTAVDVIAHYLETVPVKRDRRMELLGKLASMGRGRTRRPT